jgi:hypothetical protein
MSSYVPLSFGPGKTVTEENSLDKDPSPALSVAKARNQRCDLLRWLGAAGDALWIAELSDCMAERNRRAIWGR